MRIQAPALMTPNKGTRNQKIGSCEPRRRSFFVKSITDSVALLPMPKRPFGCAVGRAAPEAASETAKTLNTKIRSGREDFKQKFMPSAKVMKTPGHV